MEGIGIKSSDIMGRGTNVQRITGGRDINPFKPNMLEAMRGENKTLGDVLNIRGLYGKSKIISFASGQWRSNKSMAGGGILLDQGIHLLDLLSPQQIMNFF